MTFFVHGYYLDPIENFSLKVQAGSIECDDDCGTYNEIRPLEHEIRPLEHGCSCDLCQEAVCIDNSSYCDDGWTTICVQSVMSPCSCDPPPPPANQVCSGAQALAAGGGSLLGDTIFASDDEGPFCDSNDPAPSVWYSIAGTGGDISVDICRLVTN